jgi:hypothetical protein
MSLATYERRTLPSVFSDVPAHREVEAAKEEVQKARARAGRMWIWILLVMGILIAVGLFGAWAYRAYKSEEATANNLRGQLTAAENLGRDYESLSQTRARLAQVRTDLAANIDFVRRQNPQAAQRVITAAGNAWREEDRRLALIERRPASYPPLELTPASQSWSGVLSSGAVTLNREAQVMDVVVTAVNNAIARESGLGNGQRPVCNPMTGANCAGAAVCNPVTGANCGRRGN